MPKGVKNLGNAILQYLCNIYVIFFCLPEQLPLTQDEDTAAANQLWIPRELPVMAVWLGESRDESLRQHVWCRRFALSQPAVTLHWPQPPRLCWCLTVRFEKGWNFLWSARRKAQCDVPGALGRGCDVWDMAWQQRRNAHNAQKLPSWLACASCRRVTGKAQTYQCDHATLLECLGLLYHLHVVWKKRWLICR